MVQEFKALTLAQEFQESEAQASAVKALVVQVILAQAILLAQVRSAQASVAELVSKHPTSEELLESMHLALVQELLELLLQALEESQVLTRLPSVALVSTALAME